MFIRFVAEKPILTPCWNCFFDLLFAAFVIIIIQNSLPQNPAPLPDYKVPLFRTLCTCRWQEGRNQHTPAWGLPFQEIGKINGLFTLLPHLPHLWSIKEPGIQIPIRWLFWGIRLPSSWSASFSIKVFLASIPHLLDSLACCAASRAEQVWTR